MYITIRSNFYTEIKEMNLNNDTSYKTSYTNTKLGISIKKLIIFDNNLYDNIINEKIEQKFRKLIEILVNLYETETDGTSGVIKSLSEIEKFKNELKNKYKNYMSKKQKMKVVRKITLMEEELKQKLIDYEKSKKLYENYQKNYNNEEELEKDVSRRR